jgi:phage terminase large subunit-like protein
VGRISSLRNLRLTATTAIATAPLAQLQRLSQLALTVTPPLLGALAPLAGLKQLAVLHLAAISPARGWGSAFQLLKVRSGLITRCIACSGADALCLAGVWQVANVVFSRSPCTQGTYYACCWVAPLAGLKQLAVLHLAAISPARGWGSAFQLLKVRVAALRVWLLAHCVWHALPGSVTCFSFSRALF